MSGKRLGVALRIIDQFAGHTADWVLVRDLADEIVETLDGRAPTWAENRILTAGEKLRRWPQRHTEPSPDPPAIARQRGDVARLEQAELEARRRYFAKRRPGDVRRQTTVEEREGWDRASRDLTRATARLHELLRAQYERRVREAAGA